MEIYSWEKISAMSEIELVPMALPEKCIIDVVILAIKNTGKPNDPQNSTSG